MRPPYTVLSSLILAGCAASNAWRPPEISYDDMEPAALQSDPPRPVEVVEVPRLLPLPGQLKPLPGKISAAPEPKDPKERIAKANDAARVQPTRHGYLNAVQVYPFADGALYQVYAAPGEITDIALQAGEQLVGSGPVAAGDTVRWVMGDTESGAGASKRVHILAKPTRPDLVTNLVINTDRRTYLVELRSTEKTYMASVSWLYPQGSADRVAAAECGGRICDSDRYGHRHRQAALSLRHRRRQSAMAADTGLRRRLERFISNSLMASRKARCRRCSSSAMRRLRRQRRPHRPRRPERHSGTEAVQAHRR
jgi:hypothetical protein